MSAVSTCTPQDFLLSVLPSCSQHDTETGRPLVTLTFAQSLDGKIAGKGGKQLLLSCPESMLMTHWMRSMHDAILVGIGTALNDNPQLNTRLIPEGSRPANLPRPVILDTYLRLRTDCKLLNNFRQRSGPQPWIFCSSINSLELKERQSALTAAGAVVFSVECEDGLLSMPRILGELHKQGIKNLMVEGGATVINSFLECAYQSYGSGSPPIFDILIITTTPTLVGDDAVGYKVGSSEERIQLPWQHIRTEVMGKDTVVAVRCPPRLP